jgi:autotransporter-associated beta strand protein
LALSAGTLVLTGTNTYTGATTINGGTLALSGTGAIATSSQVNVANSAGTFDISATTAGATITTLKPTLPHEFHCLNFELPCISSAIHDTPPVPA